MNEHELKARVHEFLSGLRKSGRPVWFLKVHGGPMQRVGVPDYLLIVNGKAAALELKHPQERNPTPTVAQDRELFWIRHAGGNTLLSNNLEQTKAWIWSLLA